jgi:hypothetical protein
MLELETGKRAVANFMAKYVQQFFEALCLETTGKCLVQKKFFNRGNL